MDDQIYQCHIQEENFEWLCPGCALADISYSLFDTSISSCSSTSTNDITPEKKKVNHLRVVVCNFQSIWNKKLLLGNYLHKNDIDVLIGSETHLSCNISNSQFLPKHYLAIRKDRIDGKGGVIFIHRDDLLVQELPQQKSELVSIKIESYEKPVILTACYRPPSSDASYNTQLIKDISNTVKKFKLSSHWICGDFNLPDIDWESNTIVRSQYTKQLNEDFLEAFDVLNLNQLVDFTTRKKATLDLILTNRPGLTNKCEPYEGFGDHETAVFADVFCHPQKSKPIQRKIYVWHRANIEGLQKDMSEENICNDKKNSKKFFSFVKSKRTDICGLSPLLGENNEIHTKEEELAEILNNQFTSVFTEDDGTTPTPLGPKGKIINDIIITKNGVAKLLKELNPFKASGPDGIGARILKESADQVADGLTLLFNASLKQGKIPTDWKHAVVSPIFKGGNKNRSKAENYRPISLTSVTCKVLEHIVHSHIINHLEENSCLTDTQHGFRKKRSCETQLLQTIDTLARAINNKEQVDSILLDFSKAFDKEDCEKLQKDLDELVKWENKWSMEFHPDKCFNLRVTNKRKIHDKTYEIHGQQLKTVNKAKYLGVETNSLTAASTQLDNVVQM
ncbi:uncharacterized protein [Clytia hemisphaerica]|uniref:uncharacterized protein n=1 Tax=Clytia hemisphaerica TaxID=252671 RepID=UPI0034D6A86E